MKAEILKSELCGSIKAPPSKSVAHRLIICACLCDGVSHISGLEVLSNDIKATISCMRSLGADISKDGDVLTINGKDTFKNVKENDLFVDESASTLRFLIPLCLLCDRQITLVGSKRLFERPLDIYEKICCEKDFAFEKSEGKLTVRGKFCEGTYEVAGNVSSQFISGLLFALSTLDKPSTIKIKGKLESKSYVLMTLDALQEFGARISFTFGENESEIHIKGKTNFAPIHKAVEGDYSNSAFFDALNCLSHDVFVDGLYEDSIQGDKIYREYFERLNDGFCTLDISDCPDLAPVLMTVASYKHGCVLTGTKRLKIKESDRAQAMKQELSKLGVIVEVGENSVKIEKCVLHSPKQAINAHNDHRIVMAMSVLLTKYGGIIEGAESVRKSLPNYFDLLQSLGARVNLYEDE